MSISGSIPSDLKSINSQDILRPDDGTAQLEKIKQEIAEGEQSMDCGEAIGRLKAIIVFSFMSNNGLAQRE